MIKKYLCTFLAVLMLLTLLPVSALAEDGAEDEALPAAENTDEELSALGTAAAEIMAEGICGDNASWTLYDDGHLVVAGDGEMYDSNVDMTTAQKKLVLTAEIGEGITVLGGLLAYCGNMTSVTLPQTLTTIRYNALYLCESLAEITIPAGVTSIGEEAFADCYKLSSLTIPEGVTHIGGQAFYRTALTELTIPASVAEIGLDAFMCCGDLTFLRAAEGSQTYSSDEQGILYNKSGTSVMFCPPGKTGTVTVPEGVTSIDTRAFHTAEKVTAITLPSTLTELGSGTFASCLSLESLTIPSEVTELPPDLCVGCEALTAVSIPENVTRIWHDAFSGCCSLASLAIPGNVTSIGEKAFFRCRTLTTAAIPASVTEIGPDAFSECRSLASFTVADGNTKYFADAQGLLRSKDGTVLYICPCAKEGELAVPAGVTEIGSGALHECRGITSVILPDGLTTIGTDAFSNCFGLKSVTIPKSVSFIGASAFCSCDALEDIYFIGTEGEWGTIDISPIQNEIFDEVEFHFIPAEEPSLIGSGECGEDLTWTLTDEGVLTISGTGAMTDYSYGSYADWREYRDTITDLVIEDGVTTIGVYAFYSCSKIRNVSIPAGVLSVGDNAFNTCSALESLTLPASVTTIGESAFASCYSLTDVDFPGVTSIGKYALENCSGFRALALPDSLESIGSGAFSGCSGMRALYIPAGVTTIPAASFTNSPFNSCTNVTVFCEAEAAPSGWGSYWDNRDYSHKVPVVFDCPETVFEFWTSLDPEAESVVIPDGVTVIPAGIFKYFDRMKTVTIPASVTSVGDNAFLGCSALRSVLYAGTETDRAAMTVSSTGNDALSSAGWQYGYAEQIDGCLAVIPGIAEGSTVEIDGISYMAGPNGTIVLPDGSSRLAVTFTYETGSGDIHTQYPLSMTVYALTFDGSGYTAEAVEAFADALQYAGSSIRITGKQGVRMITAVPDSTRTAFISSGTAGMTLVEYGTLVAWDKDLGGADLVFGLGYEKSAHAYRRGEADPIFRQADGLTEYTNVLVGFSKAQCVPDLAMRPYMILEDAEGEQIILYGGTVHRSIGYIAWQNRNAFAPGDAAYDYIWDIIHYVYGDVYDTDYIG